MSKQLDEKEVSLVPKNVVSNNSDIFKSIVSFVSDIHIEFGKDNKGLKLYSYLLDKTKISNVAVISKHVKVFTNYFEENCEAMKDKNAELFKSKISYNDNVFIDIVKFLTESDVQTSNIIWLHLYTILNKISPSESATEYIKQLNLENNMSKEDIFINNTIEKIEQVVGNSNSSNNPMAVVSSLLSSGVFNDLYTQIQNDELDMSKMVGSVMKMVSKNGGGSAGIPPEMVSLLMSSTKNLKLN